MLSSVHFLLTYTCNFACDHCFLCCSPEARGTFTLPQLRAAFAQIDEMPSVTSVYFEGGEAFLYYALLVEGVRLAKERGLSVGIVSNAYWATTVDDARLWLRPLAKLGLDHLSVSDDDFHGAGEEDSPPKRAMVAAKELGIGVGAICIDRPAADAVSGERGKPVEGGTVQIRGRAAQTLAADVPRFEATCFSECPHEDFAQPGRIHLDSFGNVHLCQGVVLDSIWRTPLVEQFANYKPENHPIAGPLHEGGPLELGRRYGVDVSGEFADACHLCFETRRTLRARFSDQLRPELLFG